MEFRDVVRRRRMTRSFRSDPIPALSLDRILEHATRAPSAGFTQGWAFLVLEGVEQTSRFWSATFPDRNPDFAWPGLFAAPVIVIVCSSERAYRQRYAEPDKGVAEQASFWPVPFWHVDAGFAAMLMLLSAVDEGLGALFFGIFPPHLAAVQAAFAIPDDHTPIGAIAIGHPADDDRPSSSVGRGRRPLSDVVHRGSWGR